MQVCDIRLMHAQGMPDYHIQLVHICVFTLSPALGMQLTRPRC